MVNQSLVVLVTETDEDNRKNIHSVWAGFCTFSGKSVQRSVENVCARFFVNCQILLPNQATVSVLEHKNVNYRPTVPAL